MHESLDALAVSGEFRNGAEVFEIAMPFIMVR
jgi:hypothetical protein